MPLTWLFCVPHDAICSLARDQRGSSPRNLLKGATLNFAYTSNGVEEKAPSSDTRKKHFHLVLQPLNTGRRRVEWGRIGKTGESVFSCSKSFFIYFSVKLDFFRDRIAIGKAKSFPVRMPIAITHLYARDNDGCA